MFTVQDSNNLSIRLDRRVKKNSKSCLRNWVNLPPEFNTFVQNPYVRGRYFL
jgi:hypothetical protein